MRFFKSVNDGYIQTIGMGECGVEISEDEYHAISAAIENRPHTAELTALRLREDLTWEEYPIDPPDPDPEINDAELLDILMGGAV